MEQEGRGPAVPKMSKSQESDEKKDDKESHGHKHHIFAGDSSKPGIGTKIKGALHKEWTQRKA